MSRFTAKTKTLDVADPRRVDPDDAVSRQQEGEIAAEARALFADQATTAVAFCGLDAWFDGNPAETRRWANILRRLQN
ncbi:MAG: hypothetical protein SV862_14510 [Pseudomonadota bacterium]|nr:hypothetical protein [Pseudomonadota bacterium]